LGQDLGIAKMGFLGGDIVIFRPKVGEILNFKLFSWWEINLKLNKYFSIIKFYNQGPINAWSNYIIFTFKPTT